MIPESELQAIEARAEAATEGREAGTMTDTADLCGRCREAKNEVGRSVECFACLHTKKPWGRSAGLESASGYCDSDCPGYAQDPKPSSLWPGESRYDFGYGGAMNRPCTCGSPAHDAEWYGIFRGSDRDPREAGWCYECAREVYDGEGPHRAK